MEDEFSFTFGGNKSKVNLARLIDAANDYLQSPITVSKASEKNYPKKFPVQEGYKCVANSVTNAIMYIEEINPERLSLTMDYTDGELEVISGGTSHSTSIEDFLKSTKPTDSDLRDISAVKGYVTNKMGENYVTINPKSGQELLELLAENHGYCAAVLIPPPKNPGEISHATMVYARRARNNIELVEIDSLAGKEKVLSTEDLMKKLYPNMSIDDPFCSCVVIKNTEAEQIVLAPRTDR